MLDDHTAREPDPEHTRRRSIRTAGLALFTVSLVLVGCTTDDGAAGSDDEPVTDAGTADGASDASGADDETDPDEPEEGPAVPEEREPPVTTIRLFPVDAPETTAEIRVGEIIIEFDGEVTDEGTLLTLEEPILFAFDSAQLKGGARTTLDDIAEVLDYYTDAPIEVIGHTDDRGSADYNLDLSQRRADAVATALVERGIDDGRITADGRGLTEPVASNDTDEGRAANRRVEVLIVGVEPPETDG